MKQFLGLFLLLSIVSCANEVGNSNIQEAIVYMKSKDGNFDLYSSDVLGKWEERLTTNPGWDWAPHWIPKLKELVYYTNDTARNFYWVKMELGNGAQIDSLPFKDLLNLKLSPDGEWIYYMLGNGDTMNIKRKRIDGSNDEYLTQNANYNGRFGLDKKHKQMAFISDRSGSNQLYIMELESREVRQITNDGMVAKYHSFSPDGRQIAVCMALPADDPKWDIYIYDLSSGERRQLTKTPYSEQEIVWSLSGKKIAFHGTSEADGDQIYTIDIKDGKFTKITSGDFYHGEPEWIPAAY